MQQLSQLQQPGEATLLARAVWRSLQLLPALQTSWSCGPFYSIMLHQVRAVTYPGLQCRAVAVYSNIHKMGVRHLVQYCPMGHHSALRSGHRQGGLQCQVC